MAQEDHITPIQTTRDDPIKEKAAQFLATVNEDRTFTAEEEKAVLRRIDRRILPLLLGAYFFQQLDKSSLSYVSIFGIVEDANLHGKQYSWLGSILYLAQLIMQPVAALLLVKLPTGKLIGSAVFLWGSSLAIMAACKDFPSLLGLRFTLGAFEAMIGMSFNHLSFYVNAFSPFLCGRDANVVEARRADTQDGVLERNERRDLYRRQLVHLRTRPYP
jgi:hypothetical protein